MFYFFSSALSIASVKSCPTFFTALTEWFVSSGVERWVFEPAASEVKYPVASVRVPVLKSSAIKVEVGRHSSVAAALLAR